MPGQDGTGPQGKGPGTGRGLGNCGNGMQRRRGFREHKSLEKTEEKKNVETSV